jgi:hypothetical protein
MKKYTLIKDFENQKEGDVIFIHEGQVDYFVEKGYIKAKGKRKKTKTKAKIEDIQESENKTMEIN